MTDSELKYLEEMEREATPGPWTAWKGQIFVEDSHGYSRTILPSMGNAEFMAALRNAAPELFAEIKRLRLLCNEAATALNMFITREDEPLIGRLRAAGGEK